MANGFASGDETQGGDPFSYARRLVSSLGEKIAVKYDAVAVLATRSTDDLSRGANPGWVATAIKAVEDEVDDIKDSLKMQNRKLNAIFATILTTLVTLVVVLFSVIVGNGPSTPPGH